MWRREGAIGDLRRRWKYFTAGRTREDGRSGVCETRPFEVYSNAKILQYEVTSKVSEPTPLFSRISLIPLRVTPPAMQLFKYSRNLRKFVRGTVQVGSIAKHVVVHAS
jgi:hypothetical protein